MANNRSRRISEEIRKVVSSLLMKGLKDPRVSKMTSITHVDTTGDLRYATLYVSCFDKNHDIQETLDGLNSAKGFIRREIGQSLKLHYTPEPIFKADTSIENGFHINDILKTLDIDEEGNEDESDEQE